MSNNRRWLFIAEYVSIAASLLGTGFAAVSQQTIYGLAPISVSLLLNLINRHRLEALTQHRTTANAQVQQLRSAIDSLNVAYAQVKQDVQNPAPRQELTSIVPIVEELNERQNELRLSLVPLQSQLNNLIEQFNNRPELEQIESLTTVIVALKKLIDELPAGHSQPQPTALQHQVESILAQLSQNSERVEQLEKAIAQMKQQL